MTKEELENIIDEINRDFFILINEVFVDTTAYLVYSPLQDVIRIMFNKNKFKDKYFDLYHIYPNLLDFHIHKYMVNIMRIHHMFFHYEVLY